MSHMVRLKKMYAHDYQDKVTNMTCLPEELKNQHYYYPTNMGNEKKAREVLNALAKLKNK